MESSNNQLDQNANGGARFSVNTTNQDYRPSEGAFSAPRRTSQMTSKSFAKYFLEAEIPPELQSQFDREQQTSIAANLRRRSQSLGHSS